MRFRRALPSRASGFTLVITLLILTVVTILVVGLFGMADSEKQTASSFDAVEQADLAIKAGLAQASAVLEEVTRTEDAVIFAKPVEQLPGDVPGAQSREQLVAARYDPVQALWEYHPLASGTQRPLGTTTLEMDADGDGQPDEPRPVNEPTDEEKTAMERVPVHVVSKPRPVMFWENLLLPSDDSEQMLKARYCFAIEDLQGGISLERSGNLDGVVAAAPGGNPQPAVHARPALNVTATQTNHVVPGLNLALPEQLLLNGVALYTLFDPLAASDTTSILGDNRIVTARNVLVSPESWRQLLINPDPASSWSGADPNSYLERDANHRRYIYDGPRRIEEGASTGVQSYDELALIPSFADGSFAGMGEKKMNLNKVIEEIEEQTDPQQKATKSKQGILDIANHIKAHLPEFASGRIGTDVSGVSKGFSMGGVEDEADADQDGLADPPASPPTEEQKQLAYLKALAAGVIDYADTDSLPNLRLGHYRGVDAHPLVNEQWQKYEFVREVSAPSGATGRFFEYTITHFVELWNPTNHPISGEVKYSFECNGELRTAAETFDVYRTLRGLEAPEGAILPDANVPVNEAKANPSTTNDWWHPSAPLQTMAPNEYRILKFGPVRFRLRNGPSGSTEAFSCEFVGYDTAGSDMSSSYRLKFKPSGASDFAMVDMPRKPVERYQRTVQDRNPDGNRTFRKKFNLSLPGMSYGKQNAGYKNQVGDARAAFYINAHQDVVNYEDGSSPWGRNRRSNVSNNKIYGENRVNLWPDGGHSTTQTGVSGPGNIGKDARREYNDPDLPNLPNKPSSEPDRFVQVLSNRGRFFSVTELGHVFDPLMWAPYPTSPGEFQTMSTDPLYRDFADLRPGASAPSDYYCGGNTLRIGRAEHTRFRPDYRATPASGRVANRRFCATALLDLFHCGIPMSTNAEERKGDFIRVEGHVNINTASRDALRALVAGKLVMDANTKETSTASAASPLHPPMDKSANPSPSSVAVEQGDFIADQIIKHRPYLSVSELPEKVLVNREQVGLTPSPNAEQVPLFGFTNRPTDFSVSPEWSDSAAEELFARIFNSGTVRSRNFRITITGQTVRTTPSGNTQILATRSRVYQVFVRPVRRNATTGVIEDQKVEITYVRNL